MYNVWTDADEDRAGEEIYAAADRVIDGLERKIEVLETRLAAADALAEKAEQLLEHIRRGWAHGDEFNALVAAVFKYREVSK